MNELNISSKSGGSSLTLPQVFLPKLIELDLQEKKEKLIGSTSLHKYLITDFSTVVENFAHNP